MDERFASELLREVKANAKRWFIAFCVMIGVEIATIFGFLQTIEGKNIHDVMMQVDELVEAVQVFNPRLTSNFFEKLKSL